MLPFFLMKNRIPKVIITIINTPTTPPITPPYRALDSWGSENIPNNYNYKRQQVIMKFLKTGRCLTEWLQMYIQNNTELQYSVIQLLRKYHIEYCLSLLMFSLWCYFYVHFQSFSESSSCFVCTFAVIQWGIVLFWGISWWLVGVYNYNCLVYFQNLRNPVPCMEVLLEE
jgi:hypothetical protein